jgi:hypothetical protein
MATKRRKTVPKRLAPRKAMVALAPDQILRPVIGLDIDGVLGDFHAHFTQYAEMFLQREISPVYWDGSVPFWRYIGVGKAKYREMKLGYRQGRMKRSMPVFLHAAQLAKKVRSAGAEVWVCTTRPYLRHDNIDPDTCWWLKNNGIQYDGVLFGDTKYRDLSRLVGRDRVLGVLDDDPEQILRAEQAGLTGYLIDRPYNREMLNSWRSWRVSTLLQAQKEFITLTEEWKRSKGV